MTRTTNITTGGRPLCFSCAAPDPIRDLVAREAPDRAQGREVIR